MNTNISSEAVAQQYQQTTNSKQTLPKSGFVFNPALYLDTQPNNDGSPKKVTFRFLPADNMANTPFRIVDSHFVTIKEPDFKAGVLRQSYKKFPCLLSPEVPEEFRGECPICKKIEELKNLARNEKDENVKKELNDKAFSMRKGQVVYARVIDRSLPNDGPKFIRLSKTSKKDGQFDTIMGIYNERNTECLNDNLGPYNIFDLNVGKDFVMTIERSSENNKKSQVSKKILDASNKKPLSQDVNEANRWISDPRKWFDAYPVKSAEFLAIVAEGLIPVRDSQTNKLVGRTESELLDMFGKSAINPTSSSHQQTQGLPQMGQPFGQPQMGQFQQPNFQAQAQHQQQVQFQQMQPSISMDDLPF